MSHHCDLDLEDSNQTFLHDIPSRDDAPPFQVQERLSGSEDNYPPDKICPQDLDPHSDLDLEDSNLKLSHNTPACDDAPQFTDSGDIEDEVNSEDLTPRYLPRRSGKN